MKWDKYHIERETSEENHSFSSGYLTTWDQSERIPLNQLLPWKYAIEDNKLYMCMDSKTFKIIDLCTKESEEYILVKLCESGLN